jgi:hypothetical protein
MVPMPEQPVKNKPEDYEKDPEASTSDAFEDFSDSVSSTEELPQGSLLQQLVLNATQNAVD